MDHVYTRTYKSSTANRLYRLVYRVRHFNSRHNENSFQKLIPLTENKLGSKSMRMSWWSYLVMLLVYLLYLFIGALVFRSNRVDTFT